MLSKTHCLVGVFLLVVTIDSRSYENSRCKCVCPSIASMKNSTDISQNTHIANVPPNKCNCVGVILPKLDDQIKNRENEFCLRCECKYENRNVTITKVVVIIVILVISILVIYMAFLIILNPILNCRAKGNYQKHTNKEVC